MCKMVPMSRICMLVSLIGCVICQECKDIPDVWAYRSDTGVFSVPLKSGTIDSFIMYNITSDGKEETFYQEAQGFPSIDSSKRISTMRYTDSEENEHYNISLTNVDDSDVLNYRFSYTISGTFTCVKTTLNLYGKPENILLEQTDAGQLFLGNKTSLECSASPTSQAVKTRLPLDYYWLVNGEPLLTTDNRFLLSPNGTFLEIILNYDVIGLSYSCFSSDEGSTLYSSISLNVTVAFKYPPRFHHNLDRFGLIAGKLGEYLKWNSTLLSDPASTVTCEYGGRNIPLNQPLSIFQNFGAIYSLVFNPLNSSYLGEYVLSAVNTLGSYTLKVTVVEKSSPRPSTGFSIYRVTAVSLEVIWTPNWDGGETQMIQLSLRDERNPGDENMLEFNDSVMAYTFTELTPTTEYTVTIVSRNKLGGSSQQSETNKTKAAPITNLKKVKYNRKDDDVSISLQLNVDSATHFDITVCVNNMDINCTNLDVPVTTHSMEPRLGLPDTEQEFFDINMRFYDEDILVQTVNEERIHLVEGLDRNILIGIIVGVVVGVILIAVAIVITLLILRKKRRQKEPSIAKGYTDENGAKTNGFDNTACNIEGYEDVEFSRAAVRNGAPKNPPPKPPHTLVPTYADVDMKKTNNIPMQQNNYRQAQDTVFPTYADVDMKKTNNIPMQPMVSPHNNNQPQNTGEKADKKKKKTKEKDQGAPHTENYNAEESEYYNTKADGPGDQMVKVSEAQQYAPKNPGVVYAELALNGSRPDNARGKRKPDEPVQYADINFDK